MTRRWAGYEPDIVDFVRRCDTEKQAEEIIRYLERCGKITHERAAELKKRLKKEGLSFFGKKKKPDFYHRN